MMRFFPGLCAMGSILALCGCQSAPMTYYTLTPADHSGTTAGSGPPAIQAILVLRNLPAGIDTPQILIRTDDARLRVEEGGRWVAPLGDELRGALVDALRRQYNIIMLEGIRHGDPPMPKVDLTVRKFDLAEGASVTLAVDWVLNSSLSCQAEFKVPSGGTVSGVVMAGQTAVLKLSQALGAAIEASAKGAAPTC